MESERLNRLVGLIRLIGLDLVAPLWATTRFNQPNLLNPTNLFTPESEPKS